MRIVEKNAEGVVVATHFDSATDETFRNGGYSGARKAFASKKFDSSYALAKEHTLVLLVGEVAKLVHPEAKKGKKATGTPKAKKEAKKVEAAADAGTAGKAKKAVVEEKAKSVSEEGWTPPEEAAGDAVTESPPKKTCAPSMLLSMPMKSGAPPKDLPKRAEKAFDPYAESPKKKPKAKARRKVVVEEESDEESLPVQGAGDDADSEEEFDVFRDEADDDGDDDDEADAAALVPAAALAPLDPDARLARNWSAYGERVIKPAEGDGRGDEWSHVGDDRAACESVSVVRALGPPELASVFYDQGLLLLESSKWAMGSTKLAEIQKAVAAHYAAKLDEARSEGLTLKGGKSHVLKATETETLDGFNQRPGGRVDMVLDALPEVAAVDKWPWTPVVQAVLGKNAALNYTGCVVSRPGDTVQNWHIDGVHTNLDDHAKADRIIVFCPLTDLTEDTGCTEFVPTSHFASRGADAKFKNVSHMRRARHYVHAGTPIVMDYRLWHRGLPNTSNKNRFLLYTVYQSAKGKRALEDTGGDLVALGGRKFLRAK